MTFAMFSPHISKGALGGFECGSSCDLCLSQKTPILSIKQRLEGLFEVE